MLQRIVSLDGGARQLARAREALGMMPGVVAAEFVLGKPAIRVWQSEEVSESTLLQVLSGCGLTGAHID